MEPRHYQAMQDPSFPMHLPPPQPYVQYAGHGESRRHGGGRRRPGAKLSTDPQSVAARERRHRISDRFRVLRSLVPGGSKMDTVSMLEQAIHYVKFLRSQVRLHQAALVLHDQQEGGAHGFDPDAAVVPARAHGASDGLGCGELMLPLQEVLSYEAAQVQVGEGSSQELPPLPACFFLEETVPCFPSALQGEETGITGSY